MIVRFTSLPVRKILIGSLTAAVIFFTGCTENPTFLGRDLLPPSDDINIKYDTATLISAMTMESLPTSAKSNRLLVGSMRDNAFGYSRAQFMVAMRNLYSLSLGTGVQIDSLVLTFAVDTSYGDVTPQTIRVFEVDQDLIRDSTFYLTDTTYYSNADPTQFYSPVLLGSSVFHPLTDTTIKVHITNPVYINKFLSSEDSTFISTAKFQDTFKGLFINSTPVSGNGGSIIYVTPDDDAGLSGLGLYFSNDSTRAESDSLGYLYPMAFSSTSRANFFTHDYTGSIAGMSLNSQNADSLQFISGMAGLIVRLNFPEIQSWRDSGNIAINRAELILPADTTYINSSEFPDRLGLLTVDKNGSYNQVYDNVTDQSSGLDGKTKIVFNGYYNDLEQHAYVFNIGLQLQSFIRGSTDIMDFVLLSSLNSISAERTILKSPGPSGIRLRIVYTKL